MSESGDYLLGEALAVNDNGDIAGANSYGASGSTFTIEGWAVIDGTAHSFPNDVPTQISPDGIIVGQIGDPVTHAVAGGFYSIDGATPVDIGNEVNGINSDDVMVGVDSGGAGAGWTFTGSTPAEFSIPVPTGAAGVEPEAINDNGWIVGYALDAMHDPYAIFAWQLGSPQTSTAVLPNTDLHFIAALSGTDILFYQDNTAGLETVYNLDRPYVEPLADLVPAGHVFDVRAMNRLGVGGGTEYQAANPGTSSRPVILTPIGGRLPSSPLPIPHLIPVPEDPQPAVPITVRWKSKAPANDPLVLDSAQVSSDGGKTWQTVKLSKQTSTSFNTALVPGLTYQVRVAVTDSLNNQSQWTSSAPVTPLITDQTSKTLTYAGAFSQLSDSKALGGSLAETSDAGASVTATITGTRVGIIGPAGTATGSAEIYIDGKDYGPVRFDAAKTIERATLAGVTLKAGTHTVKLVATGDGTIEIDGLTSLG